MKKMKLSSFLPSQIGLCSVWLSGFLLISLSLYSTRHLPSIKDQIKRPSTRFVAPSITIFSAPAPFLGPKQSLAIKSWLALSSETLVVLFGQDPSIVSFAAQFGNRVLVESDIDFTFLGTPFFHSMLARSQASNSDISVLINPDTILLPNFISTLNYAHKLKHDWLLMVKSPNISHFPFHLDDTGHHWIQEDGKRVKIMKLQEFLVQKQRWSNCGDRVLLAWNTGELPLHAGVLPPFLYCKGVHDQWVLNEALSSDFRFVFDASQVVSSYYVESLGDWDNQSSEVFKVRESRDRNWEYMANSNLAVLYGSFYFHGTNFTNKLVKLVKCHGQYLFINAEGIMYDFQDLERERLSLWKTRISNSKGKRKWTCIDDSNLLTRKMDCLVRELSKVTFELPNIPLSLPFSLESLLHIVADKDKSVVLAVAGNNYRDMLMSWICRLRHLRISNFIVCALDPEVYQFSIQQGLPVFMDQLAPSNISFNNCHFGTECFQRVTKVKSRIVLQILELGYNVLLSDVDVYWFENPFPYIHSFGSSVLVAQSDEYNETVPINLPRRLNSGFYYARSDDPTISAMKKVVKHAAASGLSEQPSFYDVLCGEGGIHRIGEDKCLEPETNLTVHFLDRTRFPNGAYHNLWEKKNVREACISQGCVVLHNNWVSGRKRKLERQISSGLWEYDASSRLCLKRWQRVHSSNFDRVLSV